MKKLLFSLFTIFLFVNVNAQKWTLPTELVLTHIQDTFENKISDLDITLETKMDDNDEFFLFTIRYADSTSVFKMKPLTFNSFLYKLNKSIQTVLKCDSVLTTTPDSSSEHYISSLFANVLVYYRTEEKRPEVATIFLDTTVTVYIDNKGDSVVGPLHNVSAELAFYGGFIEKIQTKGTLKTNKRDIPVVFNNKYSIGISSSKNIKQLNKNHLFSDQSFSNKTIKEIQTKRDTVEKQSDSDSKGKHLKIKVGDVIRYVKTVDVNANDVSPASSTITLNQSNKEEKLYRIETSKLFEARIYTDLLGLVDETNPNGIVQIEFDKRFNLRTQRSDTRNGGHGFFQYIDAVFTYSKIESENKFMPPFEISDSSGIATYTPLSIFQNRNYSVGAMLNFWYLENQNSKFDFNIDAGFLFGRTGLKSGSAETADEFYTNNLEIPIEFGFQFIPEKRIRFSIKDRVSWFYVLNKDLSLANYQNDDTSVNNFFNTVNLDLKVDVSTRGKLFARYRFIHEWDDWNNNFSQFQFGYSFYILKENGVQNTLSKN